MPAQNLPGLILDPAHPLSRGLVGWWPLNEGGGIGINDISARGGRGALAGVTPSATSGWAGGPHGRSLAFDAVDDIVTIPHASYLALTGDMAVSFWFKTNTTGAYQTIVMKGNGGAGYPYPFHFFIQPGETFCAVFGDGASQTQATSTTAVTTYRWTHLACSRLGTTVYFYMNGAPNGSGSIGAQSVTDGGTSLAIGGRTPGTLYGVNGNVANVRLFNRPLSSGEVSRLYADPLAGALAPSNPRRYYTVAVAPPPAAATAPLSSDRLYNRSRARIWRRGETG